MPEAYGVSGRDRGRVDVSHGKGIPRACSETGRYAVGRERGLVAREWRLLEGPIGVSGDGEEVYCRF